MYHSSTSCGKPPRRCRSRAFRNLGGAGTLLQIISRRDQLFMRRTSTQMHARTAPYRRPAQARAPCSRAFSGLDRRRVGFLAADDTREPGIGKSRAGSDICASVWLAQWSLSWRCLLRTHLRELINAVYPFRAASVIQRWRDANARPQGEGARRITSPTSRERASRRVRWRIKAVWLTQAVRVTGS
jgi:hypothetical protein